MSTINRQLLIILFIIISIFSCTGSAKALLEHHVAISGNDTKGDGTLQKPWKTIAFAVSKIKGGDIITIHEGSYREPYIQITPLVSGTKEYPTTIRSAKGDDVRIYGTGKQSKNLYVMGAHSASHVIIEGLRIIGNGKKRGGALYIGGEKKPSRYVKIRNCDLIDSGKNLGSDNPSVVVFNYTENCEISNCKIYGLETSDRDGIKIWRETSKLLVQGNEVFNLLRRGIDNKHGGRDRRLIIRNNYIHDVGAMGIHLNGDRSVVEDNVLYNCKETGIGVWREEGKVGGSYCILNHNTLVNCGAGIRLGWAASKEFQECTVTNNIILNCSGEVPELSINPYRKIPRDLRHTIDYNCYFNSRYTGIIRDRYRKPFTLTEWQATSGQDRHSVQEDPELLGEPNNFKDLCDFKVSERFSKSFKTSDGRVVGADIEGIRDRSNLPQRPTNVRISTQQ